MSKELKTQNTTELSIQDSQEINLLSIISKASTDPNVDIDKMERLMDLYERNQDKQASIQFNKAMVELQMSLPEITEGGAIKHGKQIISKYARWDEDMHPVLKPILHEHGFALSFRTNTDGGVKVKAVLSHISGHSKETEINLPSDTSGSKNNVQAVASSVSYGKRYTACALLNIATGGSDDDGNKAGDMPKITQDQIAEIEEKVKSVLGDDTTAFYGWMKNTLKANSIEDLNENGMKEVMSQLDKKAKK